MDIPCIAPYSLCMPLMKPAERALAEEIAALAFVNPFLEERIELERRILGEAYVPSQHFWSLLPDLERKANIDLLTERCGQLVETLHARLRDGANASGEELRLYDEVVIYFLYDRYRET